MTPIHHLINSFEDTFSCHFSWHRLDMQRTQCHSLGVICCDELGGCHLSESPRGTEPQIPQCPQGHPKLRTHFPLAKNPVVSLRPCVGTHCVRLEPVRAPRGHADFGQESEIDTECSELRRVTLWEAHDILYLFALKYLLGCDASIIDMSATRAGLLGKKSGWPLSQASLYPLSE